MQTLGSNDVRLRSYGSDFEALDELYLMGVVPGFFWSNSIRLMLYWSSLKALDELYPMGVVPSLFGQIASV